MKTILILAMILGSLTLPAAAAPIPEAHAQRIADSIYVAEGGAKAKKPYGILSVAVSGEPEARRVCLNTIRNNWTRWEAAGSQGPYVTFLANRYCPVASDPIGNRNWIRNVNAGLKKI